MQLILTVLLQRYPGVNRRIGMYTFLALAIIVLSPLSLVVGLMTLRGTKDKSGFFTIVRLADVCLIMAGIAMVFFVALPRGVGPGDMLFKLFLYSLPTSSLYLGMLVRLGFEIL